jgi:enoyl-CoA hydratase
MPYMIKTAIEGPFGQIVIDRPGRRNALNAAMWRAIPEAVAKLQSDPEIRAIVIRGAGADAFSAGADISEFAENRADAERARAYEALNGAALRAIRDCPKPVIGLISGICFGGGLAVALACDLRIAAESAVFCLPPARLGLAYPVDGLRDLLAAVPLSAAKDMIFTARRIEAKEARDMGLVDRLVPAAGFETAAADCFGMIADNAPLTIAAAKKALDMISGRAGAATQEEVKALSALCFESADYSEGQRAFLEKRKPLFKGA